LILDEVQRNLVSARLTDEYRAARLIETLHLAFPKALVVDFEDHLPSMTNDPKDRHVLAAAVEARVDALVTFNLVDFPAAAVSAYDVQVMSPDTLLCELLTRSPRLIRQIVTEQARDLIAPPISVADVIAELEQSTPIFAKELVRHMRP
jgi:predicted nucleic acid-binding protein